MRDGNIGIREAASTVFVEHVAGDFGALRGLLRSGDAGVRVRAAARILELHALARFHSPAAAQTVACRAPADLAWNK